MAKEKKKDWNSEHVVSLNVCPWCLEDFPCKGKCILVYTGGKVPTVEIAEGIYMISPAAFIVIRKGA